MVLAWIYYATRFLFNFLRSIEALLYVTIFVFWVGIGNFAGMLALAVTTFGLIGKLFSEAIENIDEGTMEATTATGANRLQVIIYSVLPQIVPPFISYSIYQWDINVRIATIVGFRRWRRHRAIVHRILWSAAISQSRNRCRHHHPRRRYSWILPARSYEGGWCNGDA